MSESKQVPLKEIVEQIGDQFGVTVRYRVYEYYVDFFAAEVIAIEQEGKQLYWHKGASSSEDNSDFEGAERYVEGSVKWDGCAHYWFGDDDAYIHICGAGSAAQLAKTVVQIHARCGELLTEQHRIRMLELKGETK